MSSPVLTCPVTDLPSVSVPEFTEQPSQLKGYSIHTRLSKGPRGFGFNIVGGSRPREFLQVYSVTPGGPPALNTGTEPVLMLLLLIPQTHRSNRVCTCYHHWEKKTFVKSGDTSWNLISVQVPPNRISELNFDPIMSSCMYHYITHSDCSGYFLIHMRVIVVTALKHSSPRAAVGISSEKKENDLTSVDETLRRAEMSRPQPSTSSHSVTVVTSPANMTCWLKSSLWF